MAKLRKMLGNIQSQTCKDLMALLETQNKRTLIAWAVGYAKARYLPLYISLHPEEHRLTEICDTCAAYAQGQGNLAMLKPLLRESSQLAREETDPIGQAAARAVSTACNTVMTPTSSLGFLFYGAAASAYRKAGLNQGSVLYDALAEQELVTALLSLREAAVPDEPNPAKLRWNCGK